MKIGDPSGITCIMISWCMPGKDGCNPYSNPFVVAYLRCGREGVLGILVGDPSGETIYSVYKAGRRGGFQVRLLILL